MLEELYVRLAVVQEEMKRALELWQAMLKHGEDREFGLNYQPLETAAAAEAKYFRLRIEEGRLKAEIKEKQDATSAGRQSIYSVENLGALP